MDLVKEKIGDVTIINIKNERLDNNIAPELKTELLMLLEEKVFKVLINITNVNYADSSGLGALLFGLRQFRDNDGTIKLLGANSRVLSLIRIAKLEKILLNFEDKQEAIKSF